MTEFNIVGKSKPTSPLFKSKEYSTTATSLGSSAIQNLARLMYITSQVGIDDHIGRVSMMHASMRFLEPIVNFTSSIFNPDKISYGRLLRFTTAKGFGKDLDYSVKLIGDYNKRVQTLAERVRLGMREDRGSVLMMYGTFGGHFGAQYLLEHYLSLCPTQFKVVVIAEPRWDDLLSQKNSKEILSYYNSKKSPVDLVLLLRNPKTMKIIDYWNQTGVANLIDFSRSHTENDVVDVLGEMRQVSKVWEMVSVSDNDPYFLKRRFGIFPEYHPHYEITPNTIRDIIVNNFQKDSWRFNIAGDFGQNTLDNGFDLVTGATGHKFQRSLLTCDVNPYEANMIVSGFRPLKVTKAMMPHVNLLESRLDALN